MKLSNGRAGDWARPGWLCPAAAPLTLIGLLLLTGCLAVKTEVKTEHEIKPIHITMDINVKVDRELDNFFGDIDEPAQAAQEQAQ
ncbi:MAG: hypothetical protein PHR35_01290 [Kiritimatiellae bacterium]|nr:hypothetical protein [Kiritimatiellia bacterium]